MQHVILVENDNILEHREDNIDDITEEVTEENDNESSNEDSEDNDEYNDGGGDDDVAVENREDKVVLVKETTD